MNYYKDPTKSICTFERLPYILSNLIRYSENGTIAYQTTMNEKDLAANRKKLTESRVPLGRQRYPNDIAGAVMFFASAADAKAHISPQKQGTAPRFDYQYGFP